MALMLGHVTPLANTEQRESFQTKYAKLNQLSKTAQAFVDACVSLRPKYSPTVDVSTVLSPVGGQRASVNQNG